MAEIETTLHITSYNRPFLLRACVESFFVTSLYDASKLELIIVDNGSTDLGVLDYIKNLEPPCQKYSFILNDKNDYPSCLRYAKIQARNVALGKYFIDCPDDHLFMVKSGWIGQSINHIENDGTVGCVVYFAYPTYRFAKANNAMAVHDNPAFYKSKYKGYADYHIMSRTVYSSLGEYQYRLGRRAESEYMERARAAGFSRNLMKFPLAIVNDDRHSLVSPIDETEYHDIFRDQELPVTNEQLIQLGIKLQAIKRERLG